MLGGIEFGTPHGFNGIVNPNYPSGERGNIYPLLPMRKGIPQIRLDLRNEPAHFGPL